MIKVVTDWRVAFGIGEVKYGGWRGISIYFGPFIIMLLKKVGPTLDEVVVDYLEEQTKLEGKEGE